MGFVKQTDARIDLVFGSNSQLRALAGVYASEAADESKKEAFIPPRVHFFGCLIMKTALDGYGMCFIVFNLWIPLTWQKNEFFPGYNRQAHYTLVIILA